MRPIPDILLRNHANEWAELIAKTDGGKLFVARNHSHIQRQTFHDPDLTAPVIPMADAKGFSLFAAEVGLIVLREF